MSRGEPACLYLHAGHGKTGSSHLQAWLALNAEALLREHARAYPLRSPISGLKELSGGRPRFSMGNGFILEELLAERDATAAAEVLRALRGDAAGLVFSRERFLRSLPPRLPDVEVLAREAGLEAVEVLLFLRDPLEHAHSLYAEMVKAHGYVASADRWLEEYDLLDRVETFLGDVDRCARTRLTVASYSRAPDRILSRLQAWLGSPPAGSLPVPAGRANRSLTAAEVHAQRLCNRLLGRAAAAIGRRLTAELPELTGPPALASRPAQEAFVRRVRAQVERLNRRLPAEEAYALELPPPAPAGEPATLGAEQVAILVEELHRAGASIATRRSLPARLGARLRDLARRLGPG